MTDAEVEAVVEATKDLTHSDWRVIVRKVCEAYDAARAAAGMVVAGKPFKLLFTNEWLRAQIASDPDDELTVGNVDMGERYEVSFYSDDTKARCLYGRTNSLDQAREWMTPLATAGQFPWLTDRCATLPAPGSGE